MAVAQPKGVTTLALRSAEIICLDTRLTMRIWQVTLAFVFFLPKYVWGATNAVCENSNGSVLGDSFSALIINVPQETVGIHTVKGKLMDRLFLVILFIS